MLAKWTMKTSSLEKAKTGYQEFHTGKEVYGNFLLLLTAAVSLDGLGLSFVRRISLAGKSLSKVGRISETKISR